MTKIFLLGDFKIIKNNTEILKNVFANKGKTATLEYLLINIGKQIEIETLTKIIFNEENVSSGRKNTFDLLNTLKADLAQEGFDDVFELNGKSCIWNHRNNIVFDIDTLKKLCEKLQSADTLSDEISACAEDIILTYTGDLLKNSSMRDLYAKKRLATRELYIDALKKYIFLLDNVEKHSDVARVCKLALESQPLDKYFIVCFMRALVKINREKEAINYYKNIVNLYDKYLGSAPPEEVVSFYSQLISENALNEFSAQNIFLDLRDNIEPSHKENIMVCDYSVFKDIYRLYMRNFTRLKVDMHLALLTVKTLGGANQVFETEKAMTRLLLILKSTLRKGDTISRHSAMRYVILLPNTPSLEEGRIVLERIKHSFYKDANNALYSLDYKVVCANEEEENEHKFVFD